MRVNMIDQPFLLCTLSLEPKHREGIFPVILIENNSNMYVMVKELRLISNNKYEVIL